MLKEFKEFAFKGNVFDLAVGVIIGGAFGKIVASLVNDIIMPILGILIGRINFTELKYVIMPAEAGVAESAILYGSFIQAIIDFLIIAFSIFMFLKLLSKVRTKTPEAEAAPAAPSQEVLLLAEIRDLLKANSPDSREGEGQA